MPRYPRSKVPAEFRGKGKRFTTMMTKKPVGGLYRSTALIAKSVAKRVVRKEAEDKFVSTQGAVLFNSRISSSSECYPLLPQIPQGTDDWQRIGDKVRGKYLYVKGYVQLDQYYLDNTTGTQYIPPFTIRVLCLSQKNVKVGSEVSSRIDVAHLLKDNIGTGDARPYDGNVLDNLAPINKDLFKVHMDKKIKFSWVARGDLTVSGDTGYGVGQERTKYFKVRIKLPATLTFDNGNGSWPNNFAPFLCVGAVNDDGTGKYITGTPFRVGWLSTAYFEDA